MATITLSYNARSSKARAMLGCLLDSGIFVRQDAAISEIPNAATLAAFRETEEGISAGTFDTSSFEAFKKSMGL